MYIYVCLLSSWEINHSYQLLTWIFENWRLSEQDLNLFQPIYFQYFFLAGNNLKTIKPVIRCVPVRWTPCASGRGSQRRRLWRPGARHSHRLCAPRWHSSPWAEQGLPCRAAVFVSGIGFINQRNKSFLQKKVNDNCMYLFGTKPISWQIFWCSCLGQSLFILPY